MNNFRSMRPKRRRLLQLPVWDMPADPVRAVFWFFLWLLRVLVRFFFILILIAVVYESILNGVVGFFGTLLVGLGVWFGLAVLLLIVNFMTSVTRVVEDVGRMQRDFISRSPFMNVPQQPDEPEGRVVEGTITNLEEERRRRRQE